MPRLLRRIVLLAVAALAAAAALPAFAGAATDATLRLVASDPAHSKVTVTAPDGTTSTASPGLFRLRLTAGTAAPVEYRGFCADLLHHIGTGVDYSVRLRTATDEPALAGTDATEAGWLIQQGEALVAAAADKPLEAGALQVAVWQLTGQARATAPTSDALLNARAAELRILAAGRAPGGAVTIASTMARGCAGRSAVGLRLTGVPGSTAALSITKGSGALSATEVRFGADGTATASVTAALPGAVTVTARSEGGTLTRIARRTAAQTTPQETLVLASPKSYTASTTVTFEDCPLIPPSSTPTDTPVAPFETPSSTPVAPPADTTPGTPRTPTTTPRLALAKSGPRAATAGGRGGYVIRVRNRGTSALSGITVTDELPAGMSLTAMPAGARLKAGRVVWTIGSLAAGATRVLRVPVRFDADISGRRCNHASAVVGGQRRTATACTRVKALRRPIAPAVTA